MDPQVAEPYGSPTWIVDQHETHIKDVQTYGDELGIHAHAYRWLEDERVWLHDFGNQAWVEHCVRTSLEAFARALGRRCVSFRFGDRWLNTPTVDLLEQLGVRYDLTAEPGMPDFPTPKVGEPATGPTADFSRVPREPWFPSAVDFRRPASTARQIRMIPLTSAHLKFGLHPRAYLRRVQANGFRGRLQDTPLGMYKRWTAPDTFGRLLDRALAAQRKPYLAFAIRTDIGAQRWIHDAVDENLRALLEHPAAPGFRFCTPAEAMAMRDQ